jgi:hypothetical protein
MHKEKGFDPFNDILGKRLARFAGGVPKIDGGVFGMAFYHHFFANAAERGAGSYS